MILDGKAKKNEVNIGQHSPNRKRRLKTSELTGNQAKKTEPLPDHELGLVIEQNRVIEKYGLVFFHSSLPYIVVEADSNIIALNYAAEKLLQKNIHELYNTEFKNFILDEDIYSFDNLITSTLFLDQKQTLNTQLEISGIKIPVTLSSTMVPDSFECIIEIQDITPVTILKKTISNENSLHTLIEEANVGLFVADIYGNYLYVNNYGCKMSGYTLPELLKLSMKDILPASDLDSKPIQWNELLMGHHVQSERNLVKKDGSLLPVEISGKILSDGRLLGVVRDMTKQKKAENALKRSEANYIHAESIAHLGSWQMDLATGKSKWSDEFFRICGFEPQSFEPTRQIRYAVVHPEDRLKSEATIQRAIADKTSYKIEKRVLRPNGEVRHVLSVGEIILDDHNEPKELKGVFLDITDLKNIELSLKQSEEKYKSLVEFLPIGLLIKDSNGQIIFGNKKSQEILDLPTFALNELKASRKHIVVNKDETPMDPSEYPDAIVAREGITLENYEMGIELENRKIWITCTAAPMPDREEIIIAFMDITEKIIKEKQLGELSEKLQQLNATKDKFFSIIAHDLKNPFSSIMGFSELLVREIESYSKEEIAKFSGIIHETSQNAFNLLQNLLIWAQSQTDATEYRPGNYNISDIIEENIRFIEPLTLKKKITIQFNPIPAKVIRVDKNMIDTALRNILTNAVKFSFMEGEITIEIDETNDSHHISIKDNGIGIEPENICKLFRLDNKFSMPGTNQEKGSGLGLLICKEFIEKMGGKILVSSEFGKGSEFRLVLPK